MNAPGLVAPRAFFAPAGAAANGGRIDEAFSDFIPPLLLSSRPDFFLATVDTAKWNFGVITSPDEIGFAVAIIGREQLLVHGNHAVGSIPRFRNAGRLVGFGRNLFLPCDNLAPPLLAAFHGSNQTPALTPLCS